MNSMYYIFNKNFFNLLKALEKNYRVYVPVKKDEQRFYKEYTQAQENIVIGEVRPFEPLKAFFYRAREVVAEDFSPDLPQPDNKPLCIVGAKACDLKGLKVQDLVFSAQGGSAPGGRNHDYEDPFYINNRDKNFIMAADCTCSIDTCFCLALDVKPYAQQDFDISLSAVKDGFVVEVGSAKGQVLIEENSSLFEEANQELISLRDKQRRDVVKKVERNIRENNVPHQDEFKDIIEKNYDHEVWANEAKTCVECGACNTICPTCHCFLLYDQKDEEKMARLRVWDSCMIKDFARVAGGANPRPKLWMRLRNRFEKKFDFFPKVADIYACTGCGRCISACPAKIDIRKILRKLVDNA